MCNDRLYSVFCRCLISTLLSDQSVETELISVVDHQHLSFLISVDASGRRLGFDLLLH